ncbi:MAG: S9 family peptidase [Cyclobacteriaceae bacterium]
MKKLLVTFMLTLLFVHAHAQDNSKLTLERIFTNGEFAASPPTQLRWFDGGIAYTTLEQSIEYRDRLDLVSNEPGKGSKILIRAADLIPDGEDTPLQIENYDWSADKSKALIYTNSARVWRLNTKGDYWVYEMETKKLEKLGGSEAKPSTLMFAKFSPDGSKVGYVREHNIYVENLSDHSITPLTDDGTVKIINGTFDWAYEEEFSCRDGFRWSPDGKKIAYWQIDATTIRDFLLLNTTDSAYSFTVPIQYPKAGEKPSVAKIGVVDVTGGKTTWMNFPGDPSNNYLPRMIWAPDSKSLLTQHMNREQNLNRVTECDVATGSTEIVYEDKETAWLDVVNDFEFFENGKSFTWVSQKNGWKAAYLIKDGQEKRISPGDHDMMSISLLSEDSDWLYYIASPDNPTQRYLYRVKINGKGKAQRLTPEDQSGWHTYQVAPNGRYALHTYSSAGDPRVEELVSLPDHRVLQTFVTSDEVRARLKAVDRSEVEFFDVEAADGTTLECWMMKPTDFDPDKKYPVLFYVYGEPAGQTVVDRWGRNRYLWFSMLTQQGYIVMSIENRGTPGPKGREWRKSVYGKIGVLSSIDQADGAKAIIKKFDFVDESRIGIWGWSGGGSMTLNMMFRYPEIYKTGMSVAPVANQLMYDNIYQERYSGVPQLMPESYELGSPINFAENLEGNLLLMHGTGDDNVHYQNTEQLVNKLIKHNKIFSMMSYPNRTHGIREGENTSRHVYETLTRYLNDNLPAGGREWKIEEKN